MCAAAAASKHAKDLVYNQTEPYRVSFSLYSCPALPALPIDFEHMPFTFEHTPVALMRDSSQWNAYEKRVLSIVFGGCC